MANSALGAFSVLRWVKNGLSNGKPGLPTMFCRTMNGRHSTNKGSSGGRDDYDVVKQAFSTQQKRFRTYLEEFAKLKLDFDPNNEAAVKTYYHSMEKIRDNLGVNSVTVKIADLLEAAAEDAPDIRSFMEQYKSCRIEVGIEDDMDADKMMFAALDKVEGKIKKRLTKDNAEGISALKKEFDQINQKLKIHESELEALEEEAEWELAKAEMRQIHNVAVEKMNTYKRRDSIKVDVDPKELDYRNYL